MRRCWWRPCGSIVQFRTQFTLYADGRRRYTNWRTISRDAAKVSGAKIAPAGSAAPQDSAPGGHPQLSSCQDRGKLEGGVAANRPRARSSSSRRRRRRPTSRRIRPRRTADVSQQIIGVGGGERPRDGLPQTGSGRRRWPQSLERMHAVRSLDAAVTSSSTYIQALKFDFVDLARNTSTVHPAVDRT